MKYAIISDIHANESALRAVISDARANGAERIVCLGDIVGYGPLPKECVELVRTECYAAIAGNHDDAVSGRGDASGFVDIAKEAVERHRAELSEDEMEWLRSLPYVIKLEDGAFAAHGDMCDPPKFYYIMEERDAEANFAATDAQVIFVGHTHVPALFITGRSGAVYSVEPQDFTIEGHKRYVVNPGSVGYPREMNGKCLSSYVLYDSSERSVTYRYLPFSVMSVMQRGAVRRFSVNPLFAAVAAAVLAVCAVVCAVLWSMSDPATGPDESRELVVDSKTIQLGETDRKVCANLTLAPDSSMAQLTIEFKTASGKKIGKDLQKFVAKSERHKFLFPPGASEATFTIERRNRDEKVNIVHFAPSASDK